MDTMQKIFGISEVNTYIYVFLFILFSIIIIFFQIFLKKRFKKILKNFLMITVIFSMILALPFASLVNFEPFGTGTNSSLWYKQILQFSLIIGNFFISFLVIFLVISVAVNLTRNIMILINEKNNKLFFFEIILWFSFAAGICFGLINLYRILPMFSFDFSNNPVNNYTQGSKLVGLENNFKNEGYWPYFISNFLIKYFFTGNFDPSTNSNHNFLNGVVSYNQGIPIFVVLIISLFSFCFFLGIILSLNKQKKSFRLKKMNEIKKITDKPIKITLLFLPLATFSFFTESFLRSTQATFIHILFVIIVLIIAWLIFYFISGISVVYKFKINLKTYFSEIITLLKDSFTKKDYSKSTKDLDIFLKERIFENKHQDFLRHPLKHFYYFSYIADSVIFALILVGYLSFVPGNGYTSVGNVNSIMYWILLYFGGLFVMYSSFEMKNVGTASQNAIGSCALNTMAGTHTGVFAPFGSIFDRFKIVLSLNFILLMISFSTTKKFKSKISKKINKVNK